MAKKPITTPDLTDLRAFEYLNKQLFKGKLKTPVITLTSNKNLKSAFFSPDKWTDEKNHKRHDIAISSNLKNLKERYKAIAHEMVHLWQYDFGKPAKNGYHSREWVHMAGKIGFKVNGVGYIIETTVVKNGPLDMAIKTMPKDALPKMTTGKQRLTKKEKENKSGKRSKYYCETCDNKAWSRHNNELICGYCKNRMKETR